MNYLLIIISLSVAGLSNAQENRSILGLLITDFNNKTLDLSEASLLGLSDNKWSLIIVNKNINVSKQLLKQLKDSEINLEKTVIAIIGNSSKSKQDVKFYSQQANYLNPFTWLKLKDSKILGQLNIKGTPVVFGMHGNEIKWQASGYKANDLSIIKYMNNWNNR